MLQTNEESLCRMPIDSEKRPLLELSTRKCINERYVGNYGEMYNRHLQVLLPRSCLNTINYGTSGVMYSVPFATLLTTGSSPVLDGTIARIQSRGHAKCGISTSPSFGVFDRITRTWSGLDVDMCRALLAALFDGVDRHVVYTVLPATERLWPSPRAKSTSCLAPPPLRNNVIAPSPRPVLGSHFHP